MKRQCYEAPDMEVVRVELEKGFMAGSVFVDKEDSEALPIENQKKNDKEFNFGEGFGDNTWD